MKLFHINSFCLCDDEKYIFVGDKLGRIASVDIESFSILKIKQCSFGTIQTMISRKDSDIFVSLSKDFTVKIIRSLHDGDFEVLQNINIRNIGANDGHKVTNSESQALAIHPYKDIIAFYSGSHRVIEYDFSKRETPILTSVRPFGNGRVVTLRYASNGSYLLAGSGSGQVCKIQNGRIIEILNVNETDETVHWFEEVDTNDFLLASDSRNLIRYRPNSNEKLVMGKERFARDDFEHITHNKMDRRIYASSFDRHIYEIDPQSLTSNQVIIKLPFKIRWIKSLRTRPHILIAQVRNGSLYKIDTLKKEIVAEIHTGHHAIWTSDQNETGEVTLAGETPYILKLQPTGIEERLLKPSFSIKTYPFHAGFSNYVKRLIHNSVTGTDILATSKGQIAFIKNNDINIIELSNPLRDISLDIIKNHLYTVDEGGHLFRFELNSFQKELVFKTEQPLWSVSSGPGNYLAVGERLGQLHILDKTNNQSVEQTFSRLPKRIKWLDEKQLLVTKSETIDLISLKGDTWTHETEAFRPSGNTVEDFSWDRNKKYLVSINYHKKINLFDLETRELLDVQTDSFDYMKGCSFLNSNCYTYPLDFITYGRSGQIHLYRIHDEQIVPLDIIDLNSIKSDIHSENQKG